MRGGIKTARASVKSAQKEPPRGKGTARRDRKRSKRERPDDKKGGDRKKTKRREQWVALQGKIKNQSWEERGVLLTAQKKPDDSRRRMNIERSASRGEGRLKMMRCSYLSKG